MQQLFVIVVCVCVCVLHFILSYFFWGGLIFHLNLNDILHTKNDSFAYPEQIEYPNNREITTSLNSHSILYLSGVMQEILKYAMHTQVNPAFIYCPVRIPWTVCSS